MKKNGFLLGLLWAMACLAVQPLSAQKTPLERPLPESWGITDPTLYDTRMTVDESWWRVFGDATLDSLIAVALERNTSVLTALHRMQVARANLHATRAGFFPTLALDAGYTRAQTAGTASTGATRATDWTTALQMNWQVDVFGRIREEAKAKKATWRADHEAYHGAMVTLCADVATAYFQLRGAQQLLSVLQRNALSQEQVVKLTEVRYESGLAAKLDVAQARSTHYNTLSSIPSAEGNIGGYMNTLAVLLGDYPQDMAAALGEASPLPEAVQAVGVSVPAQLLRRRPDIREAEWAVQAQAATLGATRADWFPEVMLTASFGFSNDRLHRLTRSYSREWSIAPSLSWTLFKGGERLANDRAQRIQLDEAINQYNLVVLTAMQEVDNAMSGYRHSVQAAALCQQAVQQGMEALSLSVDLYKQGLSAFQTVVDAQRSVLTYENAWVEARTTALVDLVQLYQALGGGW
jgi:NodT family efflux transporter outer membrane factor (OMF) lipoprotein